MVLLSVVFTLCPHALALNLGTIQPTEGQIFNSSNTVAFTCNATDEGQVLNLTLYHDLNGTLSANQSEHYGEAYFDQNTSFLCTFNGNMACESSGTGAPMANSSLAFEDGRFSQGIRINESGLLRYASAGSFNRSQGTIEFWIRPGSDMTSDSWFAFDAADSYADDENELSIAIVNGNLRLQIYDSSGNWYYAFQDVSAWQTGEWYHVAGVWDLDSEVNAEGDLLAVYINGAGQDSSYSCDVLCSGPIPYATASSSFSIGSNKMNSKQINSTLDSFRISSVVRSASEINQSYQASLGNYSSISRTWSFSSVPDGSYSWKCAAYDNDSNENSTGTIGFHVDMYAAPSVNLISLSPSSLEDIDPGVTINVTANITDPSGVSAAIFQWKKVGDWNNITMAYNASSGLYVNASFQIDMVGGVYYYRIWSNDSGGRSGYSATQNTTGAWDFTWTRSPSSFGTVSGLTNSVNNVGLLTINNTGDDTLNFTLSHNWLLALYYNGSDEQNFYVGNHTAVSINITALFASFGSENDMTITIDASHPTQTASPLSLATNATINSYSGGPYLSISITGYSASVSQSQAFGLLAKVKNIGNETAAGTWLNWTLPDGWEASGNITQFIGNLSSGSVAWNNLTVTVNPTLAEPGTFIIYANSSCSQNASGTDSRTVGVSCSNSDGVCGHGCSYVTDSDCGIPTGPGGGTAEIRIGGGGGDQTAQYIMRMDAPSIFDIQRGEKKTLSIRIANEGKKTNLSSISLLVSGYPLTQLRISPSSIGRLEYNQTGWFEMEISVPNYTRYGMHNLTLKATASGSTSTTRNLTALERAQGITIVVRSVQENETKRALAEAEKAIQEMADAGLATGKAISLLEEAKDQISLWDYDSSLETSKKVLEMKALSFEISGLISRVEEGIREAESFGVQTPESRKMSSLSKTALQREDYAKAEERASGAVAALMIEGRGLETMRFIYANWHIMTALSAAFVAGACMAYRKSLKGRIKRKISLLMDEEKAVRSLMEKAQQDLYREKTLSRLEFHKLMSLYESSLARIRKRKARLAGRLMKLEKHPLQEFRKNEQAVRKEIQDLQRRYYEQGSVTKTAYRKTMDGLREELAESIRNIERIMERKKGQAGFLAMGILLLLAFSGMAIGQVDDRQAASDAMEKALVWMKDMEALGFPATRANDTLNEAMLLFSRGFFKGAEAMANDVQGIKERAISLDTRMDEVEESIYQARSKGMEVTQPQALFDEALEAFRQEDYERAEELLGQASSRLEEIQSDFSMRRLSEGRGWEGLVKKIQDNAPLILITAAAFSAIGIMAARIRKKRKILSRMKALDRKSLDIKAMMKELQSGYFEKGSVSQSEYKALMSRYRKKLAVIKRKKLVLDNMVRKPEKAKGP